MSEQVEDVTEQLINRIHALHAREQDDVEEETKRILLEAANAKDRSVLQRVRQCLKEKCAEEKALHETKMKALAENPPASSTKLRLSDVIAKRAAAKAVASAF